MTRWLPRVGWVDLDAEEAAALGLERVSTWQWQMFCLEWLGAGMCFMVRARAK